MPTLPSKKSTQLLSKRLMLIDSLVSDNYQHIWDCCCDHGYLGQHLAHRGAAPRVHFVDIVPEIIAQLKEKLLGREDVPSQMHVYCCDVALLPLNDFHHHDKHLIIIAGVGGDLTLSMVKALVAEHPDKQLEFILCPLRQQVHLREQLAGGGLSLLDEQLVKDDKLFYEVIHVTTGAGEPLIGIGSKLWQQPSEWHVEHLNIMLAHVKRMANNPHNNVAETIAAYQRILDQLN